MTSVHAITHALSSIASRVNAHQILLEDLKKSVHSENTPLEGADTPFDHFDSAPTVDYDEVNRLVDLKITELKDELTHKGNREKAILETGIQHSVSQKVSSAVAEVDTRNDIRLLQDRVQDLEAKLSKLSDAVRTPPVAAGAGAGAGARVASRSVGLPETSSGPEVHDDQPVHEATEEITDIKENTKTTEITEIKEIKKPAPRPRTSRRRAKAAEKDEDSTGKEGTTLSLE